MTDLPKTVRSTLADQFGSILRGKELTRLQADDSSQKLLIEWEDGAQIECVLLQNDRHHRTACVSTQVGCAMKCAFCASGMDGFVRNLSRGEILEQLLRLNALLPDNERLTHIVVMGIGEPMLNLESLLPALDEATAADGLDLSVRRVTISTVGIPEGIRKLADAVVQTGKGYKLAVSLHAPNDELRTKIIPQNRLTGIEPILKAADDYFHKTGRRVTFEYTLISGINDKQEHVRQLAALLRNRTAIVNVIPLNPVPELEYRSPPGQSVQRFVEQLERSGIQVKVRFRKGGKIAAACGQLRRSRKN
jgi:23S rRNA (adenine2503-C2)-methyltransferase